LSCLLSDSRAPVHSPRSWKVCCNLPSICKQLRIDTTQGCRQVTRNRHQARPHTLSFS
jgi:hypothetical protein